MLHGKVSRNVFIFYCICLYQLFLNCIVLTCDNRISWMMWKNCWLKLVLLNTVSYFLSSYPRMVYRALVSKSMGMGVVSHWGFWSKLESRSLNPSVIVCWIYWTNGCEINRFYTMLVRRTNWSQCVVERCSLSWGTNFIQSWKVRKMCKLMKAWSYHWLPVLNKLIGWQFHYCWPGTLIINQIYFPMLTDESIV